ncbi:tRNA pseudouridine(13) synthase TruD [Methanofollis aquaemaris]|uniref:Probable tRNA pseudouridine synthase D n=1 Tax=Methanofollis aquaemaris TaxID=126734 RepID=A0A8A3S438_9EURY|nr:tRNA pseudouridine(13) synthase TruD [Methanofollis aquaemaris]QSZ66639.1 tRNA pseudouridine(13) synthase TruD [Methanofollis aquaemaris]
MMRTPYPLEVDLGMAWYVTDTPGVGGVLRAVPEDFQVEEVPLAEPADEGSYLICRLTKRNWEHQHAMKSIASAMGISHRRIAWAGTKDKNAVTTQYISIYDVDEEAVARVHLKEIELQPVGRSQHQLALGGLAGNRFSIMVRGCTGPALQATVEACTAAAATGLPNYFGLQRFGVVRPVTHLVGREILRGDYQAAVDTYVGLAFPDESPDVQETRRTFLETGDPGPAIAALPHHLGFERAVLSGLAGAPGDYAAALKNLPPKLLSMFVSAYQSWLFNRVLSMRLADGTNLDDPLPGERLLFANGREDTVTEKNKRIVSVHMKRGRCAVAFFMPGSEPRETIGKDDERMTALLEEDGVTAEDFGRASDFVGLRYRGTLRPIAVRTEIKAEVAGQDVSLAFALPPGHYATTVCREFMKADPHAMI